MTTVQLTSPFRTIPSLPLETWRAEFVARNSPVTQAQVDDIYAACSGWAVLLDQAIGETSLKDADAIRDKNLLRLTEADGSTFRKFSAFWKPFAIKYQQLYDPAYKDGAYYPWEAGELMVDGGVNTIDGYKLSLAGYKVIYQGGVGCLKTKGKTCANNERYDPTQPMQGQAVLDNPLAPSINRSIAASMMRYGKWFGTSTPPSPPPPTGPPSGPGSISLPGLTTPVSFSFPVHVALIPKAQTNQRPGQRLSPRSRWTQHETGNPRPGTGALNHSQYLDRGAPDDNGNSQQLSYHFTVDEKEAYLKIPLDEVTWHGGDGNSGARCNYTAISCELCVQDNNEHKVQARRNAEELCGKVSAAANITQIVTHKWCCQQANAGSGCHYGCPESILNDGYWETFLANARSWM